MSAEPLRDRHRLLADSASLNTILRHATQLPHLLVFFVRSRTVAKVLSIGLVVLRCNKCSAGKS